MSNVFHVHDSLVVHKDRPDGPAEAYRAHSECTFGPEARHDERDDEQSQRHEALRLSTSDTAALASERTGLVRYRQEKRAARRTVYDSLCRWTGQCKSIPSSADACLITRCRYELKE